MNPSVADLLNSLQNQHAALYAKMGTVTDPKLGQAILLESQELLHRISVLQNLALIEAADSAGAAVTAVAGADKQLTQDLQGITEAGNLITSVSTYLVYVDKAIGFLKFAAAL